MKMTCRARELDQRFEKRHRSEDLQPKWRLTWMKEARSKGGDLFRVF